MASDDSLVRTDGAVAMSRSTVSARDGMRQG